MNASVETIKHEYDEIVVTEDEDKTAILSSIRLLLWKLK